MDLVGGFVDLMNKYVDLELSADFEWDDESICLPDSQARLATNPCRMGPSVKVYMHPPAHADVEG